MLIDPRSVLLRKTFLITEKEAGRALSTVDDLYHNFLKSDTDHMEVEEI